jgi:endo-alpha-1,4-polygalactosaminidase (GH114 family)
LFVYWRQRRRRATVKRSLARELAAIRDDYRQGEANARISVNAVARLLRRTLIGYRGRHQAAASTGDAWLEQIGRLTPETVFSQEQLDLLARGRYRRDTECDVEALLQSCEIWIRQLPREGRHAAD